MNRFQPYLRVALLAMLLAFLLLGNASKMIVHASVATEGCGSWQEVSSPSPGLYGNTLSGVVAISHTDAWAVGASVIQSSTLPTLNSMAIAEHWDGARWRVIPSPQPANYRIGLYAVAALSSNNVWAVGDDENAAGGHDLPSKTLIEHWNGTRWSVIKSPNEKTFYNSLRAVTALAPNDIWAVGTYETLQGSQKTLIEHWDGRHWSIVPSLTPPGSISYLDGVAALASNDVWAVGVYANGNAAARTLIEHWNGKQWSVVKSPNIGQDNNSLWSVAGVAPDDLWTVGRYSQGPYLFPVIEHWDGRRWSIVANPTPPGYINDLDGVAALASNDIWAVGYFRNNYQGGPLLEHWNGKQWSIVASPNQRSWYLVGVAALNAHDLWAVGSTTGNTLIMHYC